MYFSHVLRVEVRIDESSVPAQRRALICKLRQLVEGLEDDMDRVISTMPSNGAHNDDAGFMRFSYDPTNEPKPTDGFPQVPVETPEPPQ